MCPGSVLRQLAESFRRLFSCIPRRAKEPVPDVEEDFSLGVPQGAAKTSWADDVSVDDDFRPTLRRPDFQARPVKPSSGAPLAVVKGGHKPR